MHFHCGIPRLRSQLERTKCEQASLLIVRVLGNAVWYHHTSSDIWSFLIISDYIWSYLITILKLLKPQELWGSGVCLDLQRLATGLINGMAALVRAAVCESWFRAPSDQVQKSWNRKVGRRETIFDNSWIISFETYVSCNLFMSPWLPFLGSWMGCQGSGGKVGGDPNGNMGSTSGDWLLWKF